MEKFVIFGDGGHAQMIFDCLEENSSLFKQFSGFIVPTRNPLLSIPPRHRPEIPRILEQDFWGLNIDKGIVGIGDNYIREQVVQKILARKSGFHFETIIHPKAYVSKNAKLGIGTVVFPHAVVATGSQIGEHSIINTNASLDHHGNLASYVSLGPGAILGGNVSVGKSSALCLGVSCSHNISIGENAVVGMGAVVLNNIPNKSVSFGNPCKHKYERLPQSPYL